MIASTMKTAANGPLLAHAFPAQPPTIARWLARVLRCLGCAHTGLGDGDGSRAAEPHGACNGVPKPPMKNRATTWRPANTPAKSDPAGARDQLRLGVRDRRVSIRPETDLQQRRQVR